MVKRLKFTKKDFGYDTHNKKGEHLGTLVYEKQWKKWVWEQELCIMMSSNCLQGIVDFMKTLG